MIARAPRAAGPALLLAALVGGGARADDVVFTNGKTLRATTFREATRWRVNPYRSTLPEMTWGVIEHPIGDVARTEPGDDPPTLWRALDALADADVPGRLALLDRALRAKQKDLGRRVAEEVLVRAPTEARALSVAGGPEAWSARRRGDPRLDRALREEVRRVLAMSSGLERRRAAERLPGLALSPAGIERRARSLREERGERVAVPLRWGAARHPGASYALFVPFDLDPLVPAPLVLALHGGGPAGAKTDVVVGSGKEALSLFVEGARRGRAIVVAPTALEWPWTTTANDAFLSDCLDEVAARWNVDLDRVHVAGQGEGADGALWFASRHAARFATVGGAGARAEPAVALASRGLGVWLYHGEADEVVPADSVRKVASSLRKADADFVYTELPALGRGFPPRAEADWWAFALPRRRARAASAWGRPSHDEAVAPAEVEAFGPPDGAWGATVPAAADAAALLAALRRGLSDAEPAARRLHAERPDGIAAAAAAIVADRAVPVEGRTWAAWLAGELRDPAALDALLDAVRAETDAALVTSVARALRTLGSGDATQALVSALRDASARHARRSWPGGAVPWHEFDRTCRLLADLVEALGALADDPEVPVEIENAAVVGVLRDARRVAARPEAGEDPSASRARLAEACGRAYRALAAEATLYDMLRVALKSDPTATAAAVRGAAEGLARRR